MEPYESLQERRDRLQAAYGRLYTDLIAILHRADLVGIAYVADDEYEPEASTILPRLSETRDEVQVAAIIREEFDGWFYPGVTHQCDDRLRLAAQELWQAWQGYLNSS